MVNRAGLPQAICFRITRYCNARCGFCLAPPDGAHPDAAELRSRVDWLLAHGVRLFHFCGGEPTIHPALPELIGYVHERGGKTRLTTNGILMPERVLAALKSNGTRIKVSLHGDREHHDRIVGRPAFDLVTENLRQMVASRLDVSVQTTLISGGEDVIFWMARYCRQMRVRSLSFLPFIPRGWGRDRVSEYALGGSARRSARSLVREARKSFSPQLDIRWLDFNVSTVPVMEADGRLLIEGATEADDQLIADLFPVPPSGVIKADVRTAIAIR